MGRGNSLCLPAKSPPSLPYIPTSSSPIIPDACFVLDTHGSVLDQDLHGRIHDREVASSSSVLLTCHTCRVCVHAREYILYDAFYLVFY